MRVVYLFSPTEDVPYEDIASLSLSFNYLPCQQSILHENLVHAAWIEIY
jgi:hypothetical protein